ncbi:MAG: hypothetical protein A3H50_01040 [Candidatus Levybacteria bacterium RIFCSPLOWO2_02_FULL_37_10]|nr:MAG: hypothetical protein A2860_04780 [Candidatus Levybacteria bacterium RIFCSPHIGHO2_01_FULL_37_33]OGH15990.1 MAG: hypothetical protein A3C97_02085 [Candidatus Levybacteria bacterium RIFCSPHIGHO2_02_FULL_37_11]OGH29757.1 MAG: hypothetical protein A3F30_00155 [Candidatus Levybacteria bacterium RIFCSPHIGHO2_12_FULL_37_12]OGH32951.1 MAG: hypothetical protein A2953_00085 [Candidatus Levybacteria bacterium RIFCSPLOWO2_01_FULL_36_54]OGH43237.1 MAG: hypothetical protein A3H50_01040 [Candidatus Lev
MEDSAFPTPAISKSPKKPKRFLFLVVAIVIILIIIFAGNKLLGSKNNKESPKITPTPTEFQIPTDIPEPSPTDEPTSTPKPTNTPTPKPSSNPIDKTTGLDRSKLSVEVQNGSGEAGVAGKAAGILKDLGYLTSTGNADNFNYSNVTIQVKSAKSDYLSLLKKDLAASYTIGSSSSDLSASSSADALVIIGK